MIKTVYLDLDGVMVNFIGSVNEHMGIPKDTIPTKWNWVKDFGFTFKQVNNWCTKDFWANLEWTQDGHDILRVVTYKFAPANIYLLTTCMPNPETKSGKIEWIERHLPMYLDRAIILEPSVSKSKYAKPDTLLIDDKDKNVEEFTKAGGYGILVNRPWNKGYERADHTVEDLEIDLLDIVHDVGVNQ